MLYTPIIQCPAIMHRTVDERYQSRWLIVTADQQAFTKDNPLLKKIRIDIKFGYLVIQAEGMLRLDIPLEVEEDDESAFEDIDVFGEKIKAVSEGDLVAQWFSVFFNQPLRLMKLFGI
ncbi:hypothetical protein F9B74_08845 [Pelistega sp. NLN82]|uniref:Molybdenum cofactor sulfurase middle domain-containing protein n=2 Tax=Pelistega ratti TaxID=2652177 RepID=A0A6L9Y7D7_9BURK|nr:hypothetical protein [Pelistega ratti]